MAVESMLQSESRVPSVGLDGLRSHMEYFRGSFDGDLVATDLFRRGISVGYDNMWAEERDPQNKNRSPMTNLVNAPAWEGSHAGRLNEHYLAYCAGAMIGAFACREGIDLEELLDE